MPSFNKYLLGVCYVLEVVPGQGDAKMNKAPFERDHSWIWYKYKNKELHWHVRMSKVPQRWEQLSLLEAHRRSGTSEWDLEVRVGVCRVQATRWWFKARKRHLQNLRGGNVEHIREMGRGYGCRCISGMHGGAWGRGVLESQEGQLRRGQRTGPRSSSFISRQERVLCRGGRGSHRAAKRSFSSPRVEDRRKGGELAAQGDPVWPPRVWWR